MPYETRWTGDRSLFTAVIYVDGSAYEGHDADMCVAGWGLVANTSTGQPVTVSGTLPFLIQDVDGADLFGLFMFLRIARAPAQYVTDTSFVEQGVNQRGRSATEASTSAWADLCRDVWREVDAWGGLGDNFSVRKVKAHTTPEAVLAGIITADDRAGNDLADAACKLVVSEHRAPPTFHEARLTAVSAVTRKAHWIALVQRLDTLVRHGPDQARKISQGMLSSRAVRLEPGRKPNNTSRRASRLPPGPISCVSA